MDPIVNPGDVFEIDGVIGNFNNLNDGDNVYQQGDVAGETFIRVLDADGRNSDGPNTATVTKTFDVNEIGPAGEYKVTLGYYDNAGADNGGDLTLTIGNTTFETIQLDGDVDGTGEQEFTATIADGDLIQIDGTREGGDGARIDFLRFELVAIEGADNEPPTADAFAPADEATDVAVGANLTVTFNETIQAGTGNITIKNAADDSVVETIDVANATVAGTTLTLDPTADLAAATGYYVEIAAGAVTDLAGNDFAGIADATTWNFTTAAAPDTEAPTVATFAPADDGADVAVGANLVVTFSEAVQAGTGNIIIKNAADGTAVETIDVANATINGTTLTINPTADLAAGTAYYVEIAAGAVTDLAGNDFAGIADATTWNFTTVADGGTGGGDGGDGGTGGGDSGTGGGDGGTDGGTGGGTDGGTDGGTGDDTVGDTDGGTGGGTDGGTDGGTGGGTDGGTGGGTDGGTSGGTDGGTSGGTDGGTSGGTDGGTDTVEPSLDLNFPELPEAPTTDNTVPGDDADNALSGGEINDLINGGAGDDSIDGGDGDDNLAGGAGDDTINGGPGNDLIGGGPGNDRIFADEGNDAVDGDEGNDIIAGGTGNDIIKGGTGDDIMFGNADTDFIEGGEGSDIAFGGQGNDVIDGGEGNDALVGNLGDDSITGGVGNDVIFGNTGMDILDGGENDDMLFGGKGNDTLIGGAGNDVLAGNLADDVLTGGSGADRFDFLFNDGSDIITDFQDGVDIIGLEESFSFSDLTITQIDADTQIQAGFTSITLQGINASLISEADIAFIL